MVETVTGTNRSAGLSVQELMAYDTHPVPEYLRRESPMPQGPTLVPAEVYYSREFQEREMEQLWKHVWQMACHEDDLPNVGDHMPYDIGELSFLIIRSGPDEFKAYRNACLHRGRRLKERPGKKLHEIRYILTFYERSLKELHSTLQNGNNKTVFIFCAKISFILYQLAFQKFCVNFFFYFLGRF